MGRTVCTEPQCLYNGALYLFYTGFGGSLKSRMSEFTSVFLLPVEFTQFNNSTHICHSQYLLENTDGCKGF